MPRPGLFAVLVCAATACGPEWETPRATTPATSGATAKREPAIGAAVPPSVPLLVEGLDDLGLFREERAVTEDLLFRWGQANGLTLVPLERTRPILDRAARGQRIATGEACGSPLPAWRAKERYASALGAKGSLRPVVMCERGKPPCRFDVDVLDTLSLGADYLASFDAPYDTREPWASAVPRAVLGLAPKKDTGAEGGLVIGDLVGRLAGDALAAHPERLRVEARWASPGAGSDDRVTRAITFPGGTGPLRACFGQDEVRTDPLVSVDDQGVVTRCEPEDGGGDAATCACAALLSHARAAAPLRGARAWVSIGFSAADVTTPSGDVVHAHVDANIDARVDRRGQRFFGTLVSDASVADWTPAPSSAIARCFADMDSRGKVRASLTVRFDDRGHASAVEVTPGKSPGPTAAESACVERAMLTSTAPCPDTKTSWAKARLLVDAGPPATGSPFSR